MKSALVKFLKKHGKTTDDIKDILGEAGETAVGAASLGAKKTGRFVKKNPKKSAAGAAVGGYAAGEYDD